MGIKGLRKFLTKHAPNAFIPANIAACAFKKVAIDIALYLFKYKTVKRASDLENPNFWLRDFIQLVSCFRRNDVHAVFIFDGQAQADKTDERMRRQNVRDATEARVEKLEEAMQEYHQTGTVSPFLQTAFEEMVKHNQSQRLLTAGGVVATVPPFNSCVVEEAIVKRRANLNPVQPADIALTKQLFDMLDVPWIVAEGEAETLCSRLLQTGQVDAICTEDTDVLAYGSSFLSNLSSTNGQCTVVDYQCILRELQMTPESFLDFCIMCGTDYNDNIRKIGPETAFKLISQHKSIEAIAETGIDVSTLRHVRVRQLFREQYPVLPPVRYCGKPDFATLELFCVQRNIMGIIEPLRKACTREVEFE